MSRPPYDLIQKYLTIGHLDFTLIKPILCLAFVYCFSGFLWAAEDALNESAPDSEPTEKQMATTTPHYTPNVPQKRAKSLIHHMKLMERQDEIVQLSSLDNASSSDMGLDEDYYGLFLADATGSPQGAVLILHDNQQHGHWPDIVAPLREYLPQHGWTTLTIELPDTPARLRIARENIADQAQTSDPKTDIKDNKTGQGPDPIATTQEGESILTEEAKDNAGIDLQGQPKEQNEDKADENLEPALPKLAKLPELETQKTPNAKSLDEIVIDPVEHYRKQNQLRIFAAMEYLRSKGQFNLVIIGYGIGAAWAINYLAQREDIEEEPKGLTLVTIDAMPSRHNMNIDQQLKKFKTLPYLDLIQPNNSHALKKAKSRRAIMKRTKNEKYQQIITSSMTSYHESESPTNRRVRGWLKKNAGGTLVKMKP